MEKLVLNFLAIRIRLFEIFLARITNNALFQRIVTPSALDKFNNLWLGPFINKIGLRKYAKRS